MTLLLPLTTVHSLNLKHEDNLIEGYTEQHGHPPSEQSTVREWFDCMKIDDCLLFIRHALMPRFPGQKELFDTVCRDVAFICTESVIPLSHPNERHLGKAFEAARRFAECPNDTDRETLQSLHDKAEAFIERVGLVMSVSMVRLTVLTVMSADNDFANYAYSLTNLVTWFYYEQCRRGKTGRIEIKDAIESAHKRLDQLLIDLEGVTQ